MRSLVVAVFLVGCGVSDTSTGDEALTCDVGAPGALGNACIKASAPTRFDAKPLATDHVDTPPVLPNWISYGVHLVQVNGHYEGAISFTAPETATYEVYLSSSPPFAIKNRDGSAIASSCSSAITSSECSYLRRVYSVSLTKGQDVRFEIGPTTVNYVRLYVQSKTVTPPVCTAGELTEETAACDAATSGETAITAAVLTTAGNTPDLAVDTTYGVKLPAASGGYTGTVQFTPPEDAVYEVYLGTPNLPLRNYAANVWAAPSTECSRYVPSSECSKLRRGTRVVLSSNLTYRFEFGPSSSSYVRMEIREVAPATGGNIKLAYASTVPTQGGVAWVNTADLDGDGALDLVISEGDDAAGISDIRFARGSSTGSFTDAGQVRTSLPWQTVISDFDRDGFLDVVGRAWDGMGALPGFFLHGQGNLQFTSTSWGNGRDYHRYVSAADFNEDGTKDLVAAWDDSQTVADPGGFVITTMPSQSEMQLETAFGKNTEQAIAGDFNGDGHADVVAASNAASALKLYLGNGSGTVAFSQDIALPGDFVRHIEAFDLDRDGFSDVVAVHNDSTVTISYGSAIGFSTPQVLFIQHGFNVGIAAGDFDHDGRLDLAFGNSDANSAITVFLATDSGFSNAGTLAAPSGGTGQLCTGDFNQDGFDDLASGGVAGANVFLSTP